MQNNLQREGESCQASGSRKRPFRSQLERLFAEQGIQPGTYGLFFTTGEGTYLPGHRPGHRVENQSGYVVTSKGEHYSFWKDRDRVTGKIVLTDWEQVQPEADWKNDQEYVAALRSASRAVRRRS